MKLARREGLNIVPFIDVMLVLLAIVLSVSTFIAQGLVKVDLPQAQSAQNHAQKTQIVLKIDKNSNFFIDDKAIEGTQLTDYISNLNPDDLIVLKSDKDAKFESFMRIIDALQTAKHDNFAIAAEKSDE